MYRPEDFVMKVALIPVLILATSVANAESPPANHVLPKLQKGRYVLFIRHPKTNQDQADTDPLHLENVKSQRQLTDEGRKQATAIGEVLRGHNILASSREYIDSAGCLCRLS